MARNTLSTKVQSPGLKETTLFICMYVYVSVCNGVCICICDGVHMYMCEGQ